MAGSTRPRRGPTEPGGSAGRAAPERRAAVPRRGGPPRRDPRTSQDARAGQDAPSAPDAPGGPERLQKTLARAGFGSRRAVEDLIRDGRVTVDGREAALGDRVDPKTAQVAVDGVPIPADPTLRYFALNKPVGVTTTMRDPHAEATLAPLLPDGPRVFPVGRLDRDSEGLLLLTNDGDLSHRIQHPSHGVEKEYLVEVQGDLPRDVPRRLRAGIELDDGRAVALRVGPVQRSHGRSAMTIVVVEGRKRVVRRMFAALGFRVRRLVRVRIGPIRLDRLAPREVRPLRADEVAALYRATGLEQARTGGGRARRLARSGPSRSAPGRRASGAGSKASQSRRAPRRPPPPG
jgi:pseudouridine synthase